MRVLPFLLLSIILLGCSASAKYDIDAECWNDIKVEGELYHSLMESRTETTTTYACFKPKSFTIQCNTQTLQKIDDVILCTTHDEQLVRIQRIKVPELINNNEQSKVEATPLSAGKLRSQQEKIAKLEREKKEREWMDKYHLSVDANIFAIGMVEDHGTSSCDFARSIIARRIQQLNNMRSEINEFTSEYQRGNFGWLLDVHIEEIKKAYNSMCSNSIQ